MEGKLTTCLEIIAAARDLCRLVLGAENRPDWAELAAFIRKRLETVGVGAAFASFVEALDLRDARQQKKGGGCGGG